MQISHFLLQATFSAVNPLVLFAFPPSQAMKTEKVTVLGLDDVFLSIVAEEFAEFHKIRRLCYRGRDGFLVD